MQNKKKTSAIWPFFFLPFWVFNANGQEDGHVSHSDEEVTELNSISVSGQREQGPKISTQKLLKVAGAGNDPMRALEALPGVVMGDDDEAEPAVRGSSPDDNRYETDYMPMGYIFHNDGNSVYNPYIIEDFSLKAGAWDAKYYNANGAVLDTKLRDPYHQDLGAIVDLSFLRSGVLVEGAVTENSAFYASYRRSLYDVYFDSIEDEEDDLSITQVPVNEDYQLKYVYKLDPVSNLKFLASGASGHIEAEIGEDSEFAREDPTFAGNARLKQGYQSLGVSYDTMFKGGDSLLVVASQLKEDFEFKIGTLFDIDGEQSKDLVRTQYQKPLSNGDTLRFGYDFNRHTIKFTGEGRYSPCNEELEECEAPSLVDVIDLKDTLEIDSHYSFIGYDWLATPDWELSFSLGAEHNDYLSESNVQPRINSRYELNDRWTFTSAVGRHYQFPREFFAVTKSLGNPDLKMPSSDHFVVGFEYKFQDDISAKLETYYKNLHDLVVSNQDEDSADETPYKNAADGHAYGLELLINKHQTDNWYGWLSVAYSQTKRKNSETGESFDYELDRPWIINLVANYEYSERLTFGAKWRYQSGTLVTPIVGVTRYYDCGDGVLVEAECSPGDEVDFYDPLEGAKNSERLPAHHRLDVRVDYKKSDMTTFYFEARNAYGRKNVTEYEYNEDYSEKTAVSDLDFMPSIGVVMTF